MAWNAPLNSCKSSVKGDAGFHICSYDAKILACVVARVFSFHCNINSKANKVLRIYCRSVHSRYCEVFACDNEHNSVLELSVYAEAPKTQLCPFGLISGWWLINLIGLCGASG